MKKALGLKCEHREEVISQKVRTAFFHCGEVHIELLEPTDPEGPIAKFLEKNPAGGIHHIAFGTDDVAAQLNHAAAAGVKLIHQVPFEGAAGKNGGVLASQINVRSADRILRAETRQNGKSK